MSNHGESLGETNLFLHGLPYALAPCEQIHLPLLMFHTVLGLAGVSAIEYQPKLDLLAGCRRAP